MSAIRLNDDNFNRVRDNEGVSLLDFYADWCGPCRMVLPIVDEIAKEREDLLVGKINVNDNPDLAKEFGVMSIPTLIVMKDGKIGFINSRNETVLPFDFEFAPGISYVFRNGYCAMTDANKACGLIGMDGEWVLEPQYDRIWTPDANGMRLISDNGRFGLLGKDLTLAYPIEYDYIRTLDDGNMLMVKDGIKRKVAPDGTVIEDFVIDGTWEMSYPSGLEMYIDDELWPLPKYRELMFFR